MLNHLEVHQDQRGLGIGTAIIKHAELIAARMGHHQIALGVGTDNPRAHRLYLRLGYTDWGHGSVATSYATYLPDGTVRHLAENIHVLTKVLTYERPS